MNSVLVSSIFVLIGTVSVLAAPMPEDILAKCDSIRNPNESFIMKVRVTSTDSNETSLFEVSTKGKEQTLVKTLEPVRDRKRDLLMVKESMWAFVPSLNRAVQVSLSQKLTGQAANGDITRMRWAGDYQAALQSEDANQWTLALTAAKSGLTYDKILARIDKKTFRPISAEYQTMGGAALKRATFSQYKLLAGKERPSVVEISDALQASKQSKIEIVDMVVRSLPDSLFSVTRFSQK